MNEFKKNIFKKTTSIEVAPTTPTVSLLAEENENCFGQVTLRVSTNVTVKVNIIGTFVLGGSWKNPAELDLSGTKVGSDLIGDVVTFRQSYNFGIDGSKIGTITGTSTIKLEIRDNTTDALIDTYVYARPHTSVQC